jgi:hypothetical protein
MKRLFLFLAIVFVSKASIAQNAKEEAVWKNVEALTESIFGKRDSAALLNLVSDKVTYAHSNGNVENKMQMIQNAMGNRGSYRNIKIERGSIDVNGKTAVLRHNLRGASVDARGTESPLDLGILQVWKKEKGKWKIWARQAVRIPAKS